MILNDTHNITDLTDQHIDFTKIYFNDNRLFIIEWYDLIDNYNKYLMFETTIDQLKLFIDGKLDHQKMLLNGLNFWYIDDHSNLYKDINIFDHVLKCDQFDQSVIDSIGAVNFDHSFTLQSSLDKLNVFLNSFE